MKSITIFTAAIIACILLLGCSKSANNRIDIIFDTDANNELDDQHALAYLMLNDDLFNILAITTNATRSGGSIDKHYKEAEQIITLCNRKDRIKLLTGADKSFEEIENTISSPGFDGHEAVDFIINEARKYSKDNRLIVLAVGKLTNEALALKKAPDIADKIRLVWLGANYPAPGEYNLEDDIPSMNYVLNTNVHFEMVPVRYNDPSGTDAVKITKEKAQATLPGLGPKAKEAITGRHGGEFQCFGDYAADLFEHIEYYNKEQSRALYDMAAVAIIKNPDWAQQTSIPCPVMVDSVWIDQPENTRHIILWENFNKEEIIGDFYQTIKYKQ